MYRCDGDSGAAAVFASGGGWSIANSAILTPLTPE
jgi:hypothetical protein